MRGAAATNGPVACVTARVGSGKPRHVEGHRGVAGDAELGEPLQSRGVEHMSSDETQQEPLPRRPPVQGERQSRDLDRQQGPPPARRWGQNQDATAATVRAAPATHLSVNASSVPRFPGAPARDPSGTPGLPAALPLLTASAEEHLALGRHQRSLGYEDMRGWRGGCTRSAASPPAGPRRGSAGARALAHRPLRRFPMATRRGTALTQRTCARSRAW